MLTVTDTVIVMLRELNPDATDAGSEARVDAELRRIAGALAEDLCAFSDHGC